MIEQYDDASSALWDLNNQIHLISVSLHQLDENLNMSPDDKDKYCDYLDDLAHLVAKYNV